MDPSSSADDWKMPVSLIHGILAAAAIGQATETFTAGDLTVEATLASQHYVWVVTNIGRTPINDMRLPYVISYSFEAPEGWQWESSEGIFHAWTTEVAAELRDGRSGRFELRAGSGGPVLCLAPMQLGYTRDHASPPTDDVTTIAVWAPGPRPAAQGWAVAGTMLVLGIVLAALRQRRASS